MSLSIGVVGPGAIGGFLIAHLCDMGAKLSVLARPGTRDAIRMNGIWLKTGGREIVVTPECVTDDAEEIGPVNLILFTVKGQDTISAAKSMRPMVGQETRILTFQNGLYGVETLAGMFGPHQVLAGVTYVPALVEAPGRIRHTGVVKRFIFGPYVPEAASPICTDFARFGARAGLDLTYLEAPMPEIWAKFAMLTAFHLVSCMTRGALGDWIDTPETRAVYVQAMEEVVAVATACGVVVPAGLVARNLAFSVETADPSTRASMLDDLERGRALELEGTVGWLIATAGRVGVDVPVHCLGYAMLKPRIAGG
ncbi:MAG: 2-dehydropantoate 2-reductase [Amylibacter sp.]|nr:2-dehydropantoate 2-reductase [Amylibacter sp.]